MPGVRGRAGARANAIVDEAIRAIGPMATRIRIVEEAGRRCAAEGVDPPSPHSIRSRIARERMLAEPLAGDDVRLVVDRVRLGPCLVGEGRVQRPFLTLAMLDPARVIVAHSLDTLRADGPAIIAGMLARLDRRHEGAPPVIVRLPALATGGWSGLRCALVHEGVQVATPTRRSLRLGHEIGDLLGRRIGDVALGERGSRLAGLRQPVLPFDELAAKVAAAVDASNAGRGSEPRPFSLAGFRPLDERRLVQRLSGSAGGGPPTGRGPVA